MGSVFVDGVDLYQVSDEQLRQIRLRTGLAFQGGALLGSLTVEENVALPMRENTDLPDSVIEQIARMKLDMVGLLPAAGMLPASLSGGMRKRAAIARAIALDPRCRVSRRAIGRSRPGHCGRNRQLDLQDEQVFGITMVVVTHDLSSAFSIADRVAMMLNGRVSALGTKEEVWNSSDQAIRAFLERRMTEAGGRCMDVANRLEL